MEQSSVNSSKSKTEDPFGNPEDIVEPEGDTEKEEKTTLIDWNTERILPNELVTSPPPPKP